MPTTPYMSLILPEVTVTLGPEYATENNEAFTTVDSHDHTTGKGIAVPTAGIGIDADLSFASYNATMLRSTRFDMQVSPLALVTDIACLYSSGVDLWFNDGNGNQIQLTASGALNAASIGGIGGDYTTSTASVAYSSATKTFTFLQDTNKSALIDVGTILLRRVDNTSSAAITLKASTSLSSGYTVTLPTALPGATTFVNIDSSGNIGFSNSLVDLALSGGLTVGTSATIGTTLGVTGTATFDGAAVFNGNVTLGDATSDTITVTGRFASALLPSTNQATDLGSTAQQWRYLYLDRGATDGGKVFFNGGANSIGCASDGTTLTLDIITSVIPGSDATVDLGSASFRWEKLHLGGAAGTSTPTANTLYADLVPKAWTRTASTGTISESVNLTCSKGATGIYNYSFRTAMANSNYATVCSMDTVPGFMSTHTKTTSGFVVQTKNTSSTDTDRDHQVVVFGTQS